MYPNLSDTTVMPDTSTFATDDGTPFQIKTAPSTYYTWGNAVEQNLYLLVFGSTVSDKMFICPSSTDAVTNRTATNVKHYGFAGKDNISYGLQIPTRKTSLSTTVFNEAPLRDGMSGLVGIMADQSQYGPLPNPQPTPAVTLADLMRKKSANHNDEGEAVLYADSHVKFCKDDYNLVGSSNNNIFGSDVTVANNKPTVGVVVDWMLTGGTACRGGKRIVASSTASNDLR